MSMNPVTFAIELQTALVESVTEATERAAIAPERLAQMEAVEIGQTPSEVVYTENKLELLHYEAQTDEQCEVPILVVYALINRPEILDLQPDRSVIRRLLEAGHDVYMIDWNRPSRLDQHLTLSDYIDRYIDNCVDVVRERSGQERINILGYCMGGAMSAVYTSLYPEKVNALGLMAAGLCFDGTGGMLEKWGEEGSYDPRDVTKTYGNAPAEMLDEGFALMDPVMNYFGKYAGLYDNLEDEGFVENFARMEKWLGEGVDVAGEAYAEFLEKFYQQNQLYRNELEIGGRPVDVTNIQVPMLQILGEYDHLIPPEASRPFNDVVGTDDITMIEQPTGHIGLSVSGSSQKEVWPKVAEWYHDVSERASDSTTVTAETEELEQEGESAMESDSSKEPEQQEESESAAETSSEEVESAAESTEEAESARAVETIDGIGPTYAERLAEAGIETVTDLGEHDAEALAEIAQTTPARAEQWLSQC